MEDVAFNDWPGQPVDLGAGGNSWLPAYGFQTPPTLLEREDFLGIPDAEYFLQSSSTQCLYLETIHEETSDDLRSDSDMSDHTRASPLGWTTDSETDSVICLGTTNDTDDCESDREIACPIKRRRQDNLLTIPCPTDEDYQSLSRSSSLLQFETLEKQCQETSSSSPSIYSQFSYDSLEARQKIFHNEEEEEDVPSSESGDSESTIAPSKSFTNLSRAWHSFESIPNNTTNISNNSNKNRVSFENLSEDSGYSDHIMCNTSIRSRLEPVNTKRKSANKQLVVEGPNSFNAYDYCESFHQKFTGNFGASCQNLSVFATTTTSWPPSNLNIDSTECRTTKFNNTTSASEPNLTVQKDHNSSNSVSGVCSVPKNLDLVCQIKDESPVLSIAAKNWDLGSLVATNTEQQEEKDGEMAQHYYKREGSYAEAMANRVDLSDDEHSLRYRKKKSLPKHPIVDCDKKILNAISESVHSINSSSIADVHLTNIYNSGVSKRNVAAALSTPNLATQQYTVLDENNEENRRRSVQDIPRKSSLVNNSTSTSCLSDLEDAKTVTNYESGSSRGVHFSPVVSEVNWQDDSQSTTTIERESSYSLSSTPERETINSLTRTLLESTPPVQRIGGSQPDLNRLPPNRLRSCQSQPNVNNSSQLKRRGSQLVKKDGDGCVIKAYIDVDGIQYRHTHLDLDNVYGGSSEQQQQQQPVVPSPTKSHVGRSVEIVKVDAVAGMEAADAARRASSQQSKTRAGGKLGGFFSRLASFRFSNKNKDDKNKKNKQNSGEKKNVVSGVALEPHQRVASKADYIYIPLKGPPPPADAATTAAEAPVNNNKPPIASKPPLPRAPPRVVSASVKRGDGGVAQPPDHHHHHHEPPQRHQQQQHRRRRTTIDSVGESCHRPMAEPMGLIETDLDTEVTVITSGANVKTRSLLNLGAEPHQLGTLINPAGPHHHHHRRGDVDNNFPTNRPHKSMEFLLDKQNLKVVEPPENELQKGERVMSEHQLRVQRSLQKLTVPEWYKQNQVPREGFLLKKQQHQQRETRWTGTGSKTTSLSSLGSSNNQSPVILSPTSGNHQPFVRWSTSKLNSTASSPCASTRSSFNARQPNGSISPSSVRSSFSYRQPYLGWRSQERLNKPRTPAERLANSLLTHNQTLHHQQQQQHLQESPEIQTSIKEVTSAIVHYVSGLKPDGGGDDTGSQRSRSVSPRGSQKLCWLESSFVGIKPLDSPQTPVSLSESQQQQPSAPPTSLRLDLQTHNDVTLLNTKSVPRPSPGSTTLEDVLDSLLGLPSSERAPSPSLQATASANTSPHHHPPPYRRRSEGSEIPTNTTPRRVSFQSSPVLQCRYSRCGKMVTASSSDATSFKNCHNCSYTYCSRACRRAHWEKHRKTCLFSRIGSLCRQVIAAIKEQKETLFHLSRIARRGYLSQGLGAVKCFFPCPEAADKFLADGLPHLGELTYVRWPDLQPSEMGPQLYSELVQMCKSYNPDSKLVLYVSVCVVSETPASGAVKWERQLVSRCAKMRLSKDVCLPPDRDGDSMNPETLILTCCSIREDVSEDRVRELKERTVDNVQKQLRRRGVSLKRQHPVIFKQLCNYANGKCEKLTPITVYPKDVATGKSFMCIIMLEADPDSLRQVELAGVKVRTVDVLCAD